MKLLNKRIFIPLVAVIMLYCCSGCNASGVDELPHSIHQEANTQQALSLANLGDLRVVHLATEYLKDLGLNAAFQETLIEYHTASEPIVLELANEKTSEYVGEYLEVKLYYSGNQNEKPCE